jgi:spermidine synthase
MPPTASVAGLVVTLSGACALLYQVVWERLLRNSFGGDSVSSAIVTTTFLLGLGLGATVFGRWHRRPLVVYGAVQAGLGLYASASVGLIGSLGEWLAGAFGPSVRSVEGLRPLTAAASVLLLLPPCILIGGTGPLMYNAFVRPGAYRTRTVGVLYGLNTAGAAAGALAAPYLLLNRFSIGTTLRLASLANLLLAGWLWWLARRADGAAPEDRDDAPPIDLERPRLAMLLVLAGLSGAISLAFEIVVVRAAFTLNPSSPYNFPVVLAVYLVALAAGSLVTTRGKVDEPRATLARVGALFSVSASAMVLGVIASGGLTLALVHTAVPSDSALPLLAHGALLAVPLPFLAGGIFPLLLRLASPRGRTLPARSAAVYLVNAIGAGAGALLAQFAGFPTIGTRGVLILACVLGLAAGVACLQAARSRWARLAGVGGGLLSLALCTPWTAPIWAAHVYGAVALSDADTAEGVSGTAAIAWRKSGGIVFANGQLMSVLPDHALHARLASFSLVLPERRRILLLGLGGAAVLRDLLQDPAVAMVTVVDWSRELPEVLDRPRARAVLGPLLHDPRVQLCRCDARAAVRLYASGSFDVVIDNLAYANWVGATSVKSVEYFGQIGRILAPTGVFVYQGNYGTARRAILAALARVFPVVSEHPVGIVFAAMHPVDISARRVEEILVPRADRIEFDQDKAVRLFFDGLRPVTLQALAGTAPVRDDVLVHEYRQDPLRAVFSAVTRGR